MAQGIFSSITRMGTLEPFDLQVARGQVTGHTAIFRSAYSSNVSSAGTYTLWPRASAYTFPVSASVMTLSSGTSGDVGQVVLVQGLDANYNAITETIVLNGQTPVNSINSYFRINGLVVLTDSPSGPIYFGTGNVTTGVPQNIYGFIAAGDNTMLAAIYTVPAGYTLYIQGGSASAALANANKIITINFNGIYDGVDYRTAKIVTSGGYQYFPYTPPIAVPETYDLIDTVTSTDTQAGSVAVNLSGILIKNNSIA